MRTTTVADTHCPHCGLLIKEGNAPHWEEVDCIAALHARIAELEDVNMQLSGNILPRLEAAEARVAELKAAQQWRPATEAPGKGRWYQVFDADEDWFDHRYYKGPGWGVLGDDQSPLYWRPIPLMPEEAQ